MFCREQAVQLHREKASIEARGARLVMVGNGNRHFAGAFKQELGITAPLYVDTKLQAYRALELKRSLVSILRPAALWNATRALRSGFRQGFTKGDATQLGGVLVVRPGGEVLYRFASAAAGDHPPVADVVAAANAPRVP